MSLLPTSRSPDLQRLIADGYDIEVRQGYLIVHDVPYVNAQQQVKRGKLVSTLMMNDNVTQKPGDHVVHFCGDYPCRADGSPITGIQHQSNTQELVPGIVANHSFSNRPPEGYPNYHAKMTRYIDILWHPAQAIDATVTPMTYRAREAEDPADVFVYMDTASSRAGIMALNAKLATQRIAIVGLGGSGSYLMDYVAKTHVREIHLFDGDRFLQHNAFRAPGAHGLDALRPQPNKAEHFAAVYSKLRKNIVAHPYQLDAVNVQELTGFDFVFLAMDEGAPKRSLIKHLREQGIPFVDVGMGLDLTDGKIGGVLRVTTGTPAQHDHVDHRIPFGDGEDDLYARNIQIPELNALNAALAVVKWKKLAGIMRDLEGEHHTTLTLDGNHVINEVA